jgi:DNA-binding IclR family transcriptional regulator
VIYVDKADSVYSVRMYSQIGKTAPLHATGVAKAIASNNLSLDELLRYMPQPYTRFTENTRVTYQELARDFAEGRRRGFLLDDREHEESIHCIAVPILDSDGASTSAVSVTVPVHRCNMEQLLSFAPEITRIAERISAELGFFAAST